MNKMRNTDQSNSRVNSISCRNKTKIKIMLLIDGNFKKLFANLERFMIGKSVIKH